MGGHDIDEVPRTTHYLLPALGALPGHVVWRAHARVVWLLRDRLPPTTDIHAYAVLLALGDGRPRSQQDLAEAVSASRTTLARVAADLARQGLVERIRNPRDRRSYELTRTAAGTQRLADWEPDVLAAEAAVEAPFTPAESDRVRRGLKALIHEQLARDVPEQLDTSIGFLLTRLHFRWHRMFHAALGALDVEPRHFASLIALAELGPVSQSELAGLLGLSGPTVVQIVDDLEARGLVERRRSPADRRTHLLHVLPTAEAVVAEGRTIERAVVAAEMKPLSPPERDDLLDLLRRFITAP